jgi:hypothetical protein
MCQKRPIRQKRPIGVIHNDDDDDDDEEVIIIIIDGDE